MSDFDLGGIPLDRILFHPPPGTATEQDVIDQEARSRLCELVEGVLVEKAMGYLESTEGERLLVYGQ